MCSQTVCCWIQPRFHLSRTVWFKGCCDLCSAKKQSLHLQVGHQRPSAPWSWGWRSFGTTWGLRLQWLKGPRTWWGSSGAAEFKTAAPWLRCDLLGNFRTFNYVVSSKVKIRSCSNVLHVFAPSWAKGTTEHKCFHLVVHFLHPVPVAGTLCSVQIFFVPPDTPYVII